jgi:putative oxidoreductase
MAADLSHSFLIRKTQNMTSQAIPQVAVAARDSSANRLWQRVMATNSTFGPTLLRLTLGLVMFPHGAQKLLGWFGGYGFAGTMDGMTKMGLPAAVVLFVILIEFFGALMLLAGLLTRPVALGLIGLMVGAIATVHAPNGFFMNWYGNQKGEGFEYHLLVIGMALALIAMGGGKLSIDRRIAGKESRQH